MHRCSLAVTYLHPHRVFHREKEMQVQCAAAFLISTQLCSASHSGGAHQAGGKGVWGSVGGGARPHLGMGALLGPPHDGVLGYDVVVIQNADDVREQLQQLAVLVAAHLQMNQVSSGIAQVPAMSKLNFHITSEPCQVSQRPHERQSPLPRPSTGNGAIPYSEPM